VNWRAVVHWRKAQITRRAARRQRDYGHDVGWAVILPHAVAADAEGWDYHLIRRDWGIGAALRFQQQYGGWIITVRNHGMKGTT
jgi:hypothetical protein